MSPPPLTGLRVLVTRPAEQAQPWADSLASLGAVPLLYPTIQVVPPPSWGPVDESLSRIHEYAWLLFTSAAAARFTLGRIADPRSLARPDFPRIAAVGLETARALEELGGSVALVPPEARQEGLMTALSALSAGTRVLFPQAMGGRDELRNALLAQGCIVDVIPASQTIPIRDLPPVPPFDVATFASPSALRAFVAARGLDPLSHARVAVIGPTTAAAAAALGLRPIVADSPNVQALIRALCRANDTTPSPGAP